MNSITITSSFKFMEEGVDGDAIRWNDYEWLHLDVHTSHPFSDFPRNMAIIFLRLKCKAICFEGHCGDEVGADWVQYFYSAGFLFMTIELIIFRTFPTRIVFFTGICFWCLWAWLLCFFLFIISECSRWVPRASSRWWRRGVLVYISLLLSVMVTEPYNSADCNLRMCLQQAGDRCSGCR